MSAFFHGSWIDNGEYAAEGIQNLERMQCEVHALISGKVVLTCKLTIAGKCSLPSLDLVEAEEPSSVSWTPDVHLLGQGLAREA